MYDLVIKHGTLVDPSQGIHEQKDLAIEKGRIASMAKDIAPDLSRSVLNATDHIVTPGLIDIHVHVYPGVSHLGVDADATCLARGVTTVCDAGSSGANTFEGLKRYIIDVSDTRIFAFLNISTLGMLDPMDNELEDIRYANPERAISVCERHREVIQGIKVRLAKRMVGKNGLRPLALARRAAEALGMPMMVHVGDTPGPLGDILLQMRPGDILTHCFHGREYGILSAQGEVLPEVREAIDKGILFDVGHGVGSFSFAVAEAAIKQGITPGTISSDLHIYNVFGPVFDLATTMSKFLLLGLSLEDVLLKTTTAPARLLGLAGQLGCLREGCVADVAVFGIRQGVFEFEDSMQRTMVGKQKLEPVAVVRAGKLYRSVLRLGRVTA